MSEAVAAVAPSTPVAAPAAAADATPGPSADGGPAPKPSTPAQRLARASAMLSGAKPAPALGGVAEAPAADAAPEAVADAAPADAPEAPAKAEPVLEQRSGESEDKFASRLVKAISDLTAKDAALLQRDGELKSERAAREAKESELKSLMVQLADLKDPVKALKYAGMTPDELTRAMLEGKIKAPHPDDELKSRVEERAKSVEDKVAELQAKLDAKEKAEAEAAEAARIKEQQAKDLDIVKSLLPAEKFPLVAALGAHDAVLERCYSEKSQDVAGQAAEWEKHVLSQLEQLITPQTLAALETRSPKIRETVKALKGAADQSRKPVASRDGPRVLAADTVSAPSTPIERPATEAERKKRALSILFGQGG